MGSSCAHAVPSFRPPPVRVRRPSLRRGNTFSAQRYMVSLLRPRFGQGPHALPSPDGRSSPPCPPATAIVRVGVRPRTPCAPYALTLRDRPPCRWPSHHPISSSFGSLWQRKDLKHFYRHLRGQAWRQLNEASTRMEEGFPTGFHQQLGDVDAQPPRRYQASRRRRRGNPFVTVVRRQGRESARTMRDDGDAPKMWWRATSAAACCHPQCGMRRGPSGSGVVEERKVSKATVCRKPVATA
jgi:hypothetical protein